jgi:trans-aconitate methyltransferase
MAEHGVTVEAPAFFTAVNRAFHGCGAASYDTLHRHLWHSLPEQFQALVSDFLQAYPPPNHRMSALDIGCGTGMSSEMLLETRFGAFLRQIDLADPAQEMLQICSMRHSLATIRHRLMCATIETLPPRSRYDVIVAGCVLQHVPDLASFLRHVSECQAPGSVFLHVQDPNGDFRNDEQLERRTAQLQRSRHGLLKRLSRKLRQREPAAHVEAVNRELLEQKVIGLPLSEAEIARIVQFKASEGEGVSIRRMQALLPDYRLVSTRSWGFFGEMASALPSEYRRRERALLAERSPNGRYAGGIWMKLPS